MIISGYNLLYMEGSKNNLLNSLSFPQESDMPVLSSITFPHVHSPVSGIFILFP